MSLLMGKKRKGILSLMLICMAAPLFGQSQETSIGLSLKPGLASRYGDNTDGQPFFSKTGGITVNHRFGDYIGLTTGVSYFERGQASEILFTSKDNNKIREVSAKDVHRYITVPLNVIFYSGQFFIGVGPNINYCFDRERIADEDLSNFIGLACQNDFTYGAELNLGYDFKLSDAFRLGLEGYVSPIFESNLMNVGLALNFRYVLN